LYKEAAKEMQQLKQGLPGAAGPGQVVWHALCGWGLRKGTPSFEDIAAMLYMSESSGRSVVECC
jgi:hypothetical protein